MTHEQAEHIAQLLAEQRALIAALEKTFIRKFETATDWNSGSANHPSRARVLEAVHEGRAAAERLISNRVQSQLHDIARQLAALGVDG